MADAEQTTSLDQVAVIPADVSPPPPAAPDPTFGPSLSSLQKVLGLVATTLSLAGTAGLTIPTLLPIAIWPSKGDIGIVVEDARARTAITNAAIEILTPEEAVLTTVVSNDAGLARQALREGDYRVRVRHPRYATETQPVRIVKGQHADLRIEMRDRRTRDHLRPAAAPDHATAVKDAPDQLPVHVPAVKATLRPAAPDHVPAVKATRRPTPRPARAPSPTPARLPQSG